MSYLMVYLQEIRSWCLRDSMSPKKEPHPR